MVRLMDLPFPSPVPIFQCWLFVPGEKVCDAVLLKYMSCSCVAPWRADAPLASKASGGVAQTISAYAGRPTRTVGYLALSLFALRYTVPTGGTFAILDGRRHPGTDHEKQAACLLGLVMVCVRSLVLMVGFYGGWHWFLYGKPGGKPQMQKMSARKYGAESWSGYNVKRDLLASTWGTLISCAFEVAVLHLADAGKLTLDGYSNEKTFLGEYAARNALLLLAIPYWIELHFYFTHRMLHIDTWYCPIYKHIHSFHHKSTNPGPWSGLVCAVLPAVPSVLLLRALLLVPVLLFLPVLVLPLLTLLLRRRQCIRSSTCCSSARHCCRCCWRGSASAATRCTCSSC